MALRPVTPAVMAEQPLDDNVVSSHGYTTMHAAELIRLASRPDSKQRSIDRVADPPREVKELLRAINETRDFWKALRKHGTVQQCKSWLQTMVQHSTWHEVRDVFLVLTLIPGLSRDGSSIVKQVCARLAGVCWQNHRPWQKTMRL